MPRSGGISRFGRGLLLYSMFGQESSYLPVMPNELHVALLRTALMADSSAYLDEVKTTVATTPSGDPLWQGGQALQSVSTGYARARIPLGPQSGAWRASGPSGVVNAAEVRFPTAMIGWGRVRYWAALDHPRTGTVVLYGSLAAPMDVAEGQTVILNEAALRVDLDSYDTEW